MGQASPPPVNPDTVEALLETTRHLLKTADDQGTSLHARGSTLVGFGGLIISVVALLHREQTSFDPWAWSSLPVGLALVLLLAAIVTVIIVVLLQAPRVHKWFRAIGGKLRKQPADSKTEVEVAA